MARVRCAETGLMMVNAEHSGGETLRQDGGQAAREMVCCGWVLELEDRTCVYHSGVVIPVHYATFPILVGTPEQLSEHTPARVVALQTGETWEA